MKSWLTNQTSKEHDWVNQIRSDFNCDNSPVDFKTWEFLIFIFGCYIKEILDACVATFTTNQGIVKLSDLFSHIYPLNLEITWTIILKIAIGYALLIYFNFRYYGSKSLWYIIIFWIFCVAFPSFDSLVKANLKWMGMVSAIKLIISFGLFIYFFAIDPVHLDSLKLLLYDNLEIDITTGRIYRTYLSKISKKKVGKLLMAITVVVASSILLLLLMQILDKIMGSPQKKPREKSTNQKMIESIFKTSWHGWINVAISSVITAPILEELIYRRCIMKIGKYKWWTTIVSAFIFGLVHLHNDSIKQIIPYIFPGMVFATTLYISRNIWHCIFAHSAYNFITLINMMINN
ncbi:CPBP family intramembrane glutamic endopeptidase [Candidatus Mycoplasma haematohominis]|uniref:CPBP family intramembrane glutamic endopeptidase n=1 Tax=Candidatus Mycoplasma haematohominis TaxID=1494318 RepID=UPI001C0A6ECD|nr:CPBP family intramembrane glutamic endopeptidase [Candidatus Mycoplasma haemohominis]